MILEDERKVKENTKLQQTQCRNSKGKSIFCFEIVIGRAYQLFVEKTSAKQSMKCSVFKFSDVLLHLSDGPLIDEALGQVDIF